MVSSEKSAPKLESAVPPALVGSPPPSRLSYPTSRQATGGDDYHGEYVPDPYRWLEDTTDDEVRSWARAQNELTESVLARVPAREAIRARLSEKWNFARFSVPFERSGRWFQARNSGLQNQPVLYVMESPDDEGRVLLDPNVLSEDGTVALSRDIGLERWFEAGLRDEQFGLGLDDLAPARRRQRRRSRRSPLLEQVRNRAVGEGRLGVLLLGHATSASRARVPGPELRQANLFSPHGRVAERGRARLRAGGRGALARSRGEP